MKKEDIYQIIEVSFVFVVASAMYLYGFGKYFQFDNPAEVSKSAAEMTGMELMWAFYGYSKPYAILLGILEIAGGTLLLIRKTRIFGGLFLTGILLNVIAQDIFYGVNEGALKAAIIYQAMVFAILWINRDQLIRGIGAMMLQGKNTQERKRNIFLLVMAVIVALFLKFIEYTLSH